MARIPKTFRLAPELIAALNERLEGSRFQTISELVEADLWATVEAARRAPAAARQQAVTAERVDAMYREAQEQRVAIAEMRLAIMRMRIEADRAKRKDAAFLFVPDDAKLRAAEDAQQAEAVEQLERLKAVVDGSDDSGDDSTDDAGDDSADGAVDAADDRVRAGVSAAASGGFADLFR